VRELGEIVGCLGGDGLGVGSDFEDVVGDEGDGDLVEGDGLLVVEEGEVGVLEDQVFAVLGLGSWLIHAL
jgi:hypothetical protein